jgi:catechol 2,3-dioxygenase-like lactoylglutathione lyase family enzyme
LIKAVFRHTNIIAADWKKLSRFYQEVFGCTPVPPERDQSGQWLEDGTGVKGAALKGEHLLLPGFAKGGPTLEIYSYSEMERKPEALANRQGFGHIAFEVEDVLKATEEIVRAGGKLHGKVVTREVPGAGTITFTYVLDPEDNLVELQSWLLISHI